MAEEDEINFQIALSKEDAMQKEMQARESPPPPESSTQQADPQSQTSPLRGPTGPPPSFAQQQRHAAATGNVTLPSMPPTPSNNPNLPLMPSAPQHSPLTTSSIPILPPPAPTLPHPCPIKPLPPPLTPPIPQRHHPSPPNLYFGVPAQSAKRRRPRTRLRSQRRSVSQELQYLCWTAGSGWGSVESFSEGSEGGCVWRVGEGRGWWYGGRG